MLKLFSFIAISLLSIATIYTITDTKQETVPQNEINVPPPDCGDHPTNVNWSELIIHYNNCTTYNTRREGVKTIEEFIRYIQHDDTATQTVKREECHIVQSYYRRLKFCSQSHTVDSRDCDRLIETLDEAKKLVREKRFSLE